MNRTPLDLALLQQQLAFNRKLLLWAHIVSGVFVSMAYLSRVSLINFAYWNRNAGAGIAFMAVPPLVPYIISAISSRRFVRPDRIRILAFIVVITIGTAAAGAFYLGIVDIDVDVQTLFVVIVMQTACYILGAAVLLQID